MGGGQVPLSEAPAAGQEPDVAPQPPTEQQPQAEQQQAETEQVPLSAPSHMARASAVVPSLPIDGIMTACGQSPNSRIADIITAYGGMR